MGRQISTKLPTPYLYGFGENTHDTLLHDMNYRMWPIFARGSSPGRVSLIDKNCLIEINIENTVEFAERFERLRSAPVLHG